MDTAPKEALDWLKKDEEITDLDVLRRQVKYLRMIARDFSQYIDCVTSPLHRRIWWWIGGYHFRKVGRWYGRETVAFRVWYFFAEIIGLT